MWAAAGAGRLLGARRRGRARGGAARRLAACSLRRGASAGGRPARPGERGFCPETNSRLQARLLKISIPRLAYQAPSAGRCPQLSQRRLLSRWTPMEAVSPSPGSRGQPGCITSPCSLREYLRSGDLAVKWSAEGARFQAKARRATNAALARRRRRTA